MRAVYIKYESHLITPVYKYVCFVFFEFGRIYLFVSSGPFSVSLLRILLRPHASFCLLTIMYFLSYPHFVTVYLLVCYAYQHVL